MAKDTPSNPYLESSLIELVDAAHRAAAVLREKKTRTPEQLEAITERAGSLLGMLAYRLEPSMHSGDDPERILKTALNPSLFDEFKKWHELESQRAAHAVRQRTLTRAAEFVLGRKARAWYAPNEGAFDDRPNYMIHKGDEVLYELIRKLEEMQVEKVE